MSFWNKIEKPGFDDPAAPTATGSAERMRAEPVLAPPPAAAERVASAAQPARVEPARAEPARAEPAPHAADLRLGRGVRLEGKLTFSGTVRIDATFQGSIVTDGVLVVGEQAKVDADIACGTVIVEGEVNGDVVASAAVELRRTATVRGDVETPALAVERGAVFDGASRRPGGTASSDRRAGKAAAAPAPSAG